MDNSHSVIDNIYPAIDGISNASEKDLPTFESTGSISDGDDEKNIDQQEYSTDEIILSANVRIRFIPNIIAQLLFLNIIKII